MAIKRIIEDVDIDKSLKYHLVQQKCWDVNDVLAIICTIIYPFRYEYKKSPYTKIDTAKLTLCKYKAELAYLSFDGVKEYFKYEIIPAMNTIDKSCVFNVLDENKFKYDRETGVIIVGLKDNIIQAILTSYKNKAYLYDGFGVESYCKNEEAEPLSNTINDTAQIPVEETLQEGTESLEDDSTPEIYEEDTQNSEVNDNVSRDTVEQTQFPPEIKTTNKNKNSSQSKDLPYEDIKPYIELYNTIVKSRGDVSGFQYIWQWRISPTEYKDIKKVLRTELPKAKIDNLLNSKHFVFLIVAYIAEFFKREWDAHAKKGALTDIGLGNIAKSIVKKYYENWSNIVYKHENSNTQEWLDALYCEGGLPIKYIVNSKDRIQGNRREFVRLCAKLYSNPEESIEGFAENLSVKSIQYSYDKKGSIYHYIESLKDSGNGISRVLCDADLGQEPFVTFCKLLKEGLNRSREEEKFRLKYRVWKYCDEFVVRRSIVMKENAVYGETPAYIISRKRIEAQWHINNCPYAFWLNVNINDEKYGKPFHFVSSRRKSADDGILYRNDTDVIERTLPPLSSVDDKISVCYQSSDRSEEKSVQHLEFKKDGYIEFRQESLFEWIDKSSARDYYERAAILIDKNRWDLYSVDGITDELNIASPIDGLGWVEFSNNVAIKSKDGKREKHIYNTTNRIFVGIDDNSRHDITRKSFVSKEVQKGFVTLVDNNGRVTNAYLVKEPVRFYAIDDKGNDIKIKEIKYKESGVWNYEKYPKTGITKTGHIIFKIICDGYSVDKHCYILPANAEIRRCFNRDTTGRIKIKNFNCTSINGLESNSDYTIDDAYNNQPKEDYKSICIKDGECSYSIAVARPFQRYDLFKRDEIDELNSNVPILNRRQYCIRIINEDGVRRIGAGVNENIRNKLMEFLYSWFMADEKKRSEHNYTEIDDIRYTVYTKEIAYDRRVGYYVDSGNNVNAQGLSFKLLSLDDNALKGIELEEKTIREQGRDTRYLTLKLDDYKDKKGIIMQCRSGLDPFRCYKPKYKPAEEEAHKNERDRYDARKRRIEEFAKSKEVANNEITYKHFDAICECGGYFGAMDRLISLSYSCNDQIKGRGKKKKTQISPEYKLARFYLGYCKYCKDNEKKPNYEGLWRMAEEFMLDWMLIPRDIWLESNPQDHEKDAIITLFRRVPYDDRNYSKLFDDYWNVQVNSKCRSTFLRHILEGKKFEGYPTYGDLYKELDKLK